MSDDGSTSKLVATLASLIIAGLGQFLQGRKIMALVQFILWIALWAFFAGWVITIWSVIDAFVNSGD